MGYEISIVTTLRNFDGISDFSRFLGNGMKNNGVKIEMIKIDRPANKNPFYWLRLADKVRGDVALIQYEHGIWGGRFAAINASLFILKLRLRGKKVVSIVHTIMIPTKGLKGFARKIIFYTARKLVFLLSNKIIIMNKMFYNALKGKKVYYVPHGCLEEQKPVNKKIAKARYGFKENSIVIVIPGFVSPWKGHDKAIKMLSKLDDKFQLFIAGYFTEPFQRKFYDEIKELTRQLGLEKRVVFLERFVKRKEWKYIFGCADVVLLPYVLSTQSGVINVAIPYLVPIVTSKLPIFLEIEENYGCIVTSDFRTMHKAVLKALKSRKMLIKKMRSFIKDRNWKQIAKKILGVINE